MLHLVALAALLFGLAALRFQRWRRQTLARPRAESMNEKGRARSNTVQSPSPIQSAFFAAPEPDLTVTPESIDHHEARDHIYANKVIRYPYHQTMAHQAMLPEHWIEPDKHYRSDLRFKREVIEAQGKVVLDSLPEVESSCLELMLHLAQWLAKRFPACFSLSKDGTCIENHIMGETISLVVDGGGTKGVIPTFKSGNDALDVVSRLVQDDFLIAHPLGDGTWYCAGGIVAFPGFYLLSDKIGLSLHDTHSPVPQFNAKLLLSVERSLTRLLPSSPIERTSWELVDEPDSLFWAAMAGPLPTHRGRNGASAKPMLRSHVVGRAKKACAVEDPAELTLRLDHQTFVKMPKSGTVFFGVHPMRRKLRELEALPLLPQLLLKVHADSSPDLMTYKAAPMYSASVLPYLRAMHQRQVASGLIEDEEDVRGFREARDRVERAKAKERETTKQMQMMTAPPQDRDVMHDVGAAVAAAATPAFGPPGIPIAA